MKRVYAVLVALSLAVFLGSCGQTQKADAPKEETNQPKKVTHNLESEPKSIDPKIVQDIPGGTVCNSIFEGLVQNRGGEILPAAAESWEISPDGLTYTFHLRKEAKWSDGKPVTAQDFVYAWKRAVDPTYPSDYAFQM